VARFFVAIIVFSVVEARNVAEDSAYFDLSGCETIIEVSGPGGS
jgi:hypothetical protein